MLAQNSLQGENPTATQRRASDLYRPRRKVHINQRNVEGVVIQVPNPSPPASQWVLALPNLRLALYNLLLLFDNMEEKSIRKSPGRRRIESDLIQVGWQTYLYFPVGQHGG